MKNYFSNQVKLKQIISLIVLSLFLIIYSCKEDQILKLSDEEYQLKSDASDESASCPPATGYDCKIGNPDDCRINNSQNCGRRIWILVSLEMIYGHSHKNWFAN